MPLICGGVQRVQLLERDACEWQRHSVSETSVGARACHISILGHQLRDNRSESDFDFTCLSFTIERLCILSIALMKAMAGSSPRRARRKRFRRDKRSHRQNDAPARNPAKSMEQRGISCVFLLTNSSSCPPKKRRSTDCNSPSDPAIDSKRHRPPCFSTAADTLEHNTARASKQN